jgi:hypothetical protein
MGSLELHQQLEWKHFRVDLAQAASVESILTKDVSAFGGEQVEVTVAGDTVTFTYVTDMRHSDSNT